jgi:hypothetical protein
LAVIDTEILNKPQCWIAYAQWPDKDTWGNHAPLNVPTQVVAVKRMREVCLNVETIFELEPIDDLLVDPNTD